MEPPLTPHAPQTDNFKVSIATYLPCPAHHHHYQDYSYSHITAVMYSLCPSPLAHSTGCIASPAREEGVWWSGCSGHGTEECLEFYLNSIIMRMRVHLPREKNYCMQQQQLSCRVCGKELTDHRERRVLHSSANKEVLPVLEKYISQGRINPAMISPIASGGPWICKHPCYKELKRVQEIQNELQTLDIKLRGKIGSTYGVESIPITFRVEIIQDHLSPLWKIKQHLEPSKLYHCIKITHHLFTVCASSTTKATRLS